MTNNAGNYDAGGVILFLAIAWSVGSLVGYTEWAVLVASVLMLVLSRVPPDAF